MLLPVFQSREWAISGHALWRTSGKFLRIAFNNRSVPENYVTPRRLLGAVSNRQIPFSRGLGVSQCSIDYILACREMLGRRLQSCTLYLDKLIDKPALGNFANVRRRASRCSSQMGLEISMPSSQLTTYSSGGESGVFLCSCEF